MPAPVWVSHAANVPPILAPAALLDPADYGDAAAPVVEIIIPGTSALLGTPMLNRNAGRLLGLGRAGGGAWGVLAGSGLLSGSASPVAYTEIGLVIDGYFVAAAGTLALTDGAYNWVYVTQGGTVSKVTGATATPVPALPNPSVFLGRCLMAGGVLTEIDYSGRQELQGGFLYRRTADAGIPGDTPPAGAAFLHRTAGGLYLFVGGAYHLLEPLTASATWDPPALGAVGSVETNTIAVPGAQPGDPVTVTFSALGANKVLLSAHVESAGVVRAVLLNEQATGLDLPSGTLRVVVWRF